MEKLFLDKRLNDYLRMLEYEKGGYLTLLKEFAEEQKDEELRLEPELFRQILDNYQKAYAKSRIAIEEVIGRPVDFYEIDFVKMVIEYE